MKTGALILTGVLLVAALQARGSGTVTEKGAMLSASEVPCELNSVAVGPVGGIYARVNHRGELLTSGNQANWTPQGAEWRTFFRGVARGNGLFVAVGGSYTGPRGVILISSDGLKWKRTNARSHSNLYDVTFADGLFVAIGDSGTVLNSPDGRCWKRCAVETEALLTSLAYGNGTFVAGGESGTIITSKNGFRWKVESIGASLYVDKIRFKGGGFIVQTGQREITLSLTPALTEPLLLGGTR
jgi:hypothetical protein